MQNITLTQTDVYSLNSIKYIVTGILTDIAYIVFSKHNLVSACLCYNLITAAHQCLFV
jgi:hypothetical protein